MSTWISSLLTRFFAGGVLCCLIMTLAGEGAQREIARLCCAAVMIVITLSPYAGAGLPDFSVLGNREALEDTVEQALEESKGEQQRKADENLAALIEAQSQALGAPCRAEVLSSLSDDGAYSVLSVRLAFGPETETHCRNQAAASCAALCGIDESQVFEETEEKS